MEGIWNITFFISMNLLKQKQNMKFQIEISSEDKISKIISSKNVKRKNKK